jgi:hypothetical protein
MRSILSFGQKLVFVLVTALMLVPVINQDAIAQDVYKPLPANVFPSGPESFTGVQYVNSQVYRSPIIDAWNFDSLQYLLHFTDSVNISSIKIIRYAYSTATVGDTSSTLGTVVSTNSGGKTVVIVGIDSVFTNKNAAAGYQRLLITFNSSGNPSGGNIGKKFWPYMHGFK